MKCMKEPMKNSERFILAYNTISKELERMLGVKKYVPFYRLVDMGKKKNSIIMTYKDELKDLSHLRNAIIHDKSFPEYAIAEPHISIVELIEKIANELVKPKKLIPFFEKKVKTFQKDDKIIDVLREVKKKRYSQFPVYDQERFVGLVTNRGITGWIASNMDNDRTAYLDGKLSDVLTYESNNEQKYVFMNKDQNVYDVREKYLQHTDIYSTRLEAVLITENGDPSEKLLGIVTPYDLMKIHTK